MLSERKKKKKRRDKQSNVRGGSGYEERGVKLATRARVLFLLLKNKEAGNRDPAIAEMKQDSHRHARESETREASLCCSKEEPGRRTRR